jgi:hypothetical protein
MVVLLVLMVRIVTGAILSHLLWIVSNLLIVWFV